MKYGHAGRWLAKYWIEWVCLLVSGGIALFAKHYVKIQKESWENKWKEKEKNMCGKIIETLEKEINEVEEQSKSEDEIIRKDLDNMHKELDSLGAGILSLQGKQFRDLCEQLLILEDQISLEEYEDFEAEYSFQYGSNVF